MSKAVSHLKKSDRVMRGIVERIGACKMQFGEPTFHSLAEAIVYQQLNGKAAVTIFKRFAALSGEPLTPAGILKLTPEQLRSVGLSKQKSSYLFDMSERADRGDLDFSRLSEMSDDEVIEHLTAWLTNAGERPHLPSPPAGAARQPSSQPSLDLGYLALI